MRVLLPLTKGATNVENIASYDTVKSCEGVVVVAVLEEQQEHHQQHQQQQHQQQQDEEELTSEDSSLEKVCPAEEQEKEQSPCQKRPPAEASIEQKKKARLDSKPPARPSMAVGKRISSPENRTGASANDWANYTYSLPAQTLENELPPSSDDASSSAANPADEEEEEEGLGLLYHHAACSTCSSSNEKDVDFSEALKARGLEIVQQEGDGNCLFRAVALQVYGDASMHVEVRERCMDFMAREAAHFSQFVTGEPFDMYVVRKRKVGVHGNNVEIQAMSELFNRPVEVFTPDRGATPLNIFHAEYKTDYAPIRLSYHDGNHYNAVVDPLVPTAGLGLGLPGLQPGLADKLQVAKAVAESDRMADEKELERALKESENDELQRALKESSFAIENMYEYKALALSDLDATNFELEQAVLESSIEEHRRQEHGRKRRASPRTSMNRRRQSPELPAFSESMSSVAAIPPAVASVPTVASVAGGCQGEDDSEDNKQPAILPVDEYPSTVQELVMNGFELREVVRAYELVGPDFDDLLAFLMSSNS